MDKQREERKLAHIKHALQVKQGPWSPGWEDLHPVHHALLRHDYKDINTEVTLFNKRLQMPLLINAMTGGASGLEGINAALARAAKLAGIGLAVGSQAAGVRNREVRNTYKIVREIYPQGLIIANIGALSSPEDAATAVEMIEADALQIHLNGAQELLMVEGDRDFRGMAENIARIIETVPVPVIVKEVGFGISAETALALYRAGAAALDISGAGGTNFAGIELARNKDLEKEHLIGWGIPAACSLLEVKSLKLPLPVIASGGINNSLDMFKAIVVGAHTVGVAGTFLRVLIEGGESLLNQRIQNIQEEFAKLMILSGAGAVDELAYVPLVITGFTREWCEQRGVDTGCYARRKQDR